MKRVRIKTLITLMTISLVGILFVQITWISGILETKQEVFNHTVYSSLKQTAEEVRGDFLFDFGDVDSFFPLQGGAITRLFNSLTSPDLNVSPETVDLVLREKLEKAGIDIDYKFVLISKGRTIYHSSDNIDLSESYAISIYSNPLHHNDLMLAVVFPQKNGFIAGSISYLIIASLLFLAVIIATFSLSLNTIYNQKRLSQLQRDFVNNMTHEFKTPIATISVAADTVKSPTLLANPEKIPFFINMIKQEITRMNDHVEKILKVARFEKAEISLYIEEVEIDRLIKLAISSHKLIVEKRGGSIVFNPGASGVSVFTDSSHMRTVFSNILDNANKYCEEKPEIVVTSAEKSGGVEITFQDNGKGMSKRVSSQIFNRFYRETTGNIHNIKGFGLGLSFVKNILDACDGEISVDSIEGVGSCFTIFIPYNKVD